MNVQTAISTGFRGMFIDMPDDEKNDQIKAVKHLQMLANINRIDLSNVDLLEFSSSRGRLYTDKKKLNELFFYFSKKVTPIAVENKVDDPTLKAMIESIKVDFDLRRKNRIASIKRDITGYLNNLDSYQHYINQLFACFQSKRMELVTLGEENVVLNEDSIMATIHKVLADKDYAFFGKSTNRQNAYEWVTARDVIQSEVNPIAGINRTVNFGKLRVSINFSQSSIMVFPHERNLLTAPGGYSGSGYYHPHVNTRGEICWGDQSKVVTEKLLNTKYDEVFKILTSILYNYNPASPYVSLQTFEQIERDMNSACAKGCGFRKLECTCKQCINCGRKGDDCRCYTCPICGEWSATSKLVNRNCDCCTVCKVKKRSECHCCEICGSNEYNECGCCQDCENTEGNCECDSDNE